MRLSIMIAMLAFLFISCGQPKDKPEEENDRAAADKKTENVHEFAEGMEAQKTYTAEEIDQMIDKYEISMTKIIEYQNKQDEESQKLLEAASKEFQSVFPIVMKLRKDSTLNKEQLERVRIVAEKAHANPM